MARKKKQDETQRLGALPDGAHALVAAQQSEGASVADELRGLQIATQEDYDLVRETVAEAKRRKKFLDDERKKITQPLDAAKDAVQRLFRPAIEQWGEVEAAGKHAIVVFDTARAEAQRVAAEALAAEIARAGSVDEVITAESVALESVSAPAIDTAGAAVVVQWEAEVVDLAALVRAVADGRAPLEMLRPDESVIRAYARAHEGSVPIDGVRFFEARTVRVRS